MARNENLAYTQKDCFENFSFQKSHQTPNGPKKIKQFRWNSFPSLWKHTFLCFCGLNSFHQNRIGKLCLRITNLIEFSLCRSLHQDLDSAKPRKTAAKFHVFDNQTHSSPCLQHRVTQSTPQHVNWIFFVLQRKWPRKRFWWSILRNTKSPSVPRNQMIFISTGFQR